MAKLFYSLEEAAAKLSISQDQIRQMAKSGKLQQFRDGENLMFKREQVDAMAASADSGLGGTGAIPVANLGDTGEIAAPGGSDDTGQISLSDSGETGVIDSPSPSDATGEIGLADSGMLSGSEMGASATGGDVVAIDSGDSALDGSGMGGSVLGGSGLRGSELASGDTMGGTMGGTIADLGSSGMLSGLGTGTGSTGLLGSAEDKSAGSSGVGSSGLLDDVGSGSGLGSGVGSSGLLAGVSSGDTVMDMEAEGTGLIDLADGDNRAASGISVFDADEVDEADPSAQTIMADIPGSGAGELALDSVGSGSGLLDLTREADDTSLGAEILDEIYPGAADPGETTADTALEPPSDTVPGASSGVFDGSVTLEAKDASGVEIPEAVEAVAEAEPVDLEAAAAPTMVQMPAYAEEAYDPFGSGMSTGMLLVTSAALIMGLIIAMSTVAGFTSSLTTALGKDTQTIYIVLGGGIGLAIVFGIVGGFIGKILNK